MTMEKLRNQLEEPWHVGKSLCRCNDCACCEIYKMFKNINEIDPVYWLKNAKFSYEMTNSVSSIRAAMVGLD